MSLSTILHLDMDAFFASVEQSRDPALKGKPVCVGGIPGQDRAVVASPSYEARKYGIRTGMPITRAQKLCPQAVFLRVRGDAYLEISRRMVKILEDFSDRVEPSSIDESYVDITGMLNYWGGAEAIGRKIKERIRGELGLSCSVGIAPTRTLAKMATDLNKPDGLTIITREDIEKVVYPLPVEKVPGIGPRLKKALNEMGIFNLGQLAGASLKVLHKRFGSNGTRLQEIVRGETDWEVVPDDERPDEKSIGHSRTFSSDTSDPEKLKSYLLSLVQMVGRRMRAAEMAFRTVTLTIRYGDFHTVTHRKSIPRESSDENDIFSLAWGLFEERYLTGAPVRLLGVSVSNLIPLRSSQMDLFDRKGQLFQAVDTLRDKYGESAVLRTPTLDIRLRDPRRMPNFARPTRKEQKRRTG